MTYYDNKHPIILAAKSHDVSYSEHKHHSITRVSKPSTPYPLTSSDTPQITQVRSLLHAGRPSEISIHTLLHACILAGLAREAQPIIQLLDLEFDEGIDFSPGHDQNNPLTVACKVANNVAMVDMLLKAHASPNLFTVGCKCFNTYQPLWEASLMNAERPPPTPTPAPSAGGKQQVLKFSATGVGFAAPLPPPPPAFLTDEVTRRKEIIRLLVKAGAGTTLNEDARQPIDGGWGSGDPEPKFSEKQKELIRTALEEDGGVSDVFASAIAALDAVPIIAPSVVDADGKKAVENVATAVAHEAPEEVSKALHGGRKTAAGSATSAPPAKRKQG